MTLAGLRGPQGPQGVSIQSVILSDDDAASPSVSFNSATGVLTLFGLRGPAGPRGISIESVTVTSGEGLPNASFDPTTGLLTLSGLKGEKGEKGDKGEKGEKGEKGDSGDSAGAITNYGCLAISRPSSSGEWRVTPVAGLTFPESYYVGLQINTRFKFTRSGTSVDGVINGKITRFSGGELYLSEISSSGIRSTDLNLAVQTGECKVAAVQSGAASGFVFGAGKSLSRTGTAYWGPGSNFTTTAANAAEDASIPMPTGGTLGNLFVAVTASPGGYAFEFTVLVDRLGSDDSYLSNFQETQISCSITGVVKSCRNSTSTEVIRAGDRIVIRVRQTSSSNSGTSPPLMQFSMTLAP